MTAFTKNIVRVDKNISYHYLHFKKYSLDDSKLMFLLLVYLAKQHQYDLFGNGVIDPVQFCKEFNLQPQHYIWSKHENPRQLKENTAEELKEAKIPVFDSVFENSLYCLYIDIFQFPKDTGKFYYSKFAKYQKGEGVDSIQFITSLNIRTVKVGKTNKKVYDYELSEKFIANLSFLFFNVNINSLKISSRKNNDGLYFEIKNIINEMVGKNISVKELDFNEIKAVLGINSEEASYVKKKMKKAFSELLELPDLKDKGVSFSWFTLPNHKFEYGIKFHLETGANEILNKQEREQAWREVKHDLLRNLLLAAYKRRYPEAIYLPMAELKHNYSQWLKDSRVDVDSKRTTFVDFHKSTATPDLAKKLEWMATSFPEELSKEYEKYI